MESLWGEEFEVKSTDIKNIIKKIKQPKEVKELTTEKLLKSKKVSTEDKIVAIEKDVHKILGGYEKDTICIRTYENLVKYFDRAVENGVIAVDTETNNTLDTITCKLMGLCIYTPGEKNVYVPVNHTKDGKLLENQVTEAQIGEQLKRLDSTFNIFHNATFDIEVLYTTCGVKLRADWDTMVAAQLLNENELKGLKTQYKIHINPDQDKYDIEHLFKGLPYEIFEPELFALYAATDSYMTYELYKYQKAEFDKPENKDIYELLTTVEIPLIEVIADMELTGVEADVEYAKKMSLEYHKKSDEIQSRIDEELLRLKPTIDAWRLTKEANDKSGNTCNGRYMYIEGSGMCGDAPYWIDTSTHKQVSDQERTKLKLKKPGGKSKNEQLADPIELSSPTQLAILLYDILKVPVVDKAKPRTTDSAALETLAEEKHVHICELMLEKREVDILINTFIDKIPEYVSIDGRVHARFNQCGTATGRFSSTSPNLQQIPSHDKFIRMIFKASCNEHIVEQEDNYYKVMYTDDVLISNNDVWKKVKDIKIGDSILNSENTFDVVKNIVFKEPYYYLYI